MNATIDTTFDAYSDTPASRDPDSHSPTLRKYHRLLWSKPLPDGTDFSLSVDQVGSYLHHESCLGEYVLSSDSIGHTYRYVKAMAHIIGNVPPEELNQFFRICSTVGAYMVFPARKIDRKPTINAARGLNSKIKDRFDLTLECIKRHYNGLESPLGDALARYADFFDLFGCFKGYVDFFLLQDLISDDRASIKFFLPFQRFDASPLPLYIDEYRLYKKNVTAFINAR